LSPNFLNCQYACNPGTTDCNFTIKLHAHKAPIKAAQKMTKEQIVKQLSKISKKCNPPDPELSLIVIYGPKSGFKKFGTLFSISGFNIPKFFESDLKAEPFFGKADATNVPFKVNQETNDSIDNSNRPLNISAPITSSPKSYKTFQPTYNAQEKILVDAGYDIALAREALKNNHNDPESAFGWLLLNGYEPKKVSNTYTGYKMTQDKDDFIPSEAFTNFDEQNFADIEKDYKVSSSSPVDQIWICESCLDANEMSAKKCDLCHAHRGASKLVARPKKKTS